jgi:hypothetical protein
VPTDSVHREQCKGGRPDEHSHTALVDFPERKFLAVAPTTGRRTVSSRAGYWLAASVVGLGLYASLTPSPLYRTYSILWHFSPLTLTLIYASRL